MYTLVFRVREHFPPNITLVFMVFPHALINVNKGYRCCYLSSIHIITEISCEYHNNWLLIVRAEQPASTKLKIFFCDSLSIVVLDRVD